MTHRLILAGVLLLSLSVFPAATTAGQKLIANEGGKLCIFDSDGKVEWEMKIKGAPHDLHVFA